MAVTLKEVAARAGVSRLAVSRTFTPGAPVSALTRARVVSAPPAFRARVEAAIADVLRVPHEPARLAADTKRAARFGAWLAAASNGIATAQSHNSGDDRGNAVVMEFLKQGFHA